MCRSRSSGAHYREIEVSAITPNPRQPRRTFDEEALDELAESIRQVGLLQPVVVRAAGPGRYELIMGERRWRACQRAGLTEIGAIVKQTQDNELLRDALIENLHRQQLDPLEEAAAYQQLLDDFGATHEELARKIGRSRPHISNTLRLLNLPPAVQKRVAAGVLSAGHARALLGLELPKRKSAWPAGSWPRACRSAPSRRSSRSVPTIRRRAARSAPAGRRPHPASVTWPTASPICSRPGSRWNWAAQGEDRRRVRLIDDLERIVKAMNPRWSGAGARPVAYARKPVDRVPPRSMTCRHIRADGPP